MFCNYWTMFEGLDAIIANAWKGYTKGDPFFVLFDKLYNAKKYLKKRLVNSNLLLSFFSWMLDRINSKHYWCYL